MARSLRSLQHRGMAMWHIARLRFAPAFRALGVCEHSWLRYNNNSDKIRRHHTYIYRVTLSKEYPSFFFRVLKSEDKFESGLKRSVSKSFDLKQAANGMSLGNFKLTKRKGSATVPRISPSENSVNGFSSQKNSWLVFSVKDQFPGGLNTSF